MPSTHLCLHYHVVFATKDRRPTVVPEVEQRLHAYLGGVIRGMGGTPLEIGGVLDHIHVLLGLSATHTLADVLRIVKSDSSRWMRHELKIANFSWQEGYCAFTVSQSFVPRVAEYIRSQKEHHRVKSFRDEYRALLVRHEIPFDERYLW